MKKIMQFLLSFIFVATISTTCMENIVIPTSRTHQKKINDENFSSLYLLCQTIIKKFDPQKIETKENCLTALDIINTKTPASADMLVFCEKQQNTLSWTTTTNAHVILLLARFQCFINILNKNEFKLPTLEQLDTFAKNKKLQDNLLKNIAKASTVGISFNEGSLNQYLIDRSTPKEIAAPEFVMLMEDVDQIIKFDKKDAKKLSHYAILNVQALAHEKATK